MKEESVFVFKQRKKVFFIECGSSLKPTQPPVHWIRGALSLEVKRQGREADYPPHLVTRLRMMELRTRMSSLHGAQFSIGTTLPLPLHLSP
jgi:hypothetical protein